MSMFFTFKNTIWKSIKTIVFFVFLFSAFHLPVSAFVVSGYVLHYDEGGVPIIGDVVESPTNFATATAYRTNVTGNCSVDPPGGCSFVTVPEPTPPYNIYPIEEHPDYTFPAQFLWDVGSSDWPAAPGGPISAGDNAIVILETYPGLHGWEGDSYVAGVKDIITSSHLLSESIVFNAKVPVMQKIPTPVVSDSTSSSISIEWEALMDLSAQGDSQNSVVGYLVYRRTNGGVDGEGAPLYLPVSGNFVSHQAGELTYTDYSVSHGNEYSYRISVAFAWDANTPSYYETRAQSSSSGEASTGAPQPTQIGFLTAIQTIIAGTKSQPITIQTQESSGNEASVTSDTIINLISNASGSNSNPIFYSVEGGACTDNIIETLEILTGDSTAQFCYYEEKASQNPTNPNARWRITASKVDPASPSWQNGSYSIGVSATDLDSFGVSFFSPQKNRTKFSGENTIAALDVFGNIVLDFDASDNNVVLTNVPEDEGLSSLVIKGLFGEESNLLNSGSDFINGIANLSNRISVEGVIGSYIFTATSEDLKKGDSESVEIESPDFYIPLGIPVNLFFTSPSQIILPDTSSEEIEFVLTDFEGFRAKAIEDVTVTVISNSPTGLFSLYGSVWVSSLTVIIPVGSSLGSFYYIDSSEGIHDLIIQADDFTPDMQNIKITSDPEDLEEAFGLEFVSPPRVVFGIDRSEEIVFGLVDSDGFEAELGHDVTINVISSSGTGLFSTTGFGSWVGSLDIVINAGDSLGKIFYRDITQGIHTMTISESDLGFDTQLIKIEDESEELDEMPDPVRLFYTTPEQIIETGMSSDEITFRLADENGFRLFAKSNIIVTVISTSATGLFSLDGVSGWASSLDLELFRGFSGGKFYYKDYSEGVFDLIIDSLNLDSDTQKIKVQDDPEEYEEEFKLIFVTPPQIVDVDTVSDAISFRISDSEGFESLASEDTLVTVTSNSSTGLFSLNGGDNWLSTMEIMVLEGSSLGSLYYKDSSLGDHSLNISATGLEPDNQLIRIVEKDDEVPELPAPTIFQFGLSFVSPQRIGFPFSDGISTVTVRDLEGNLVKDFDASVYKVWIQQEFMEGVVSGLGRRGNNVLDREFDFIQGVANLEDTMIYRGNIGEHRFKASLGPIVGVSNLVDFTHGDLDRFDLSFNSPQENDNYFSTANIVAKDIGNNIVSNFDASSNNVLITSDIGNMSISGAGPSVLSSASDFVDGVAVLDDIVKYTGLNGLRTIKAESDNAKEGSTIVEIISGDIHSVRINDSLGENGGEIGGLTLYVGTPALFYAAFYDVSGNFVGNLEGSWSSTGTLDTVNIVDSNTLEFEPLTSPSSGTIVFTDSELRTASTGIIVVEPAEANYFDVSLPDTAVAGEPFYPVEIVARDRFGNISSSYNGFKTISISGAGDGLETGQPTSIFEVEFVDGVAVFFEEIILVKVEEIELTLAEGSISGSDEIRVLSGSPHHLHINSPAVVNAGVPFDFNEIYAHDEFGNIATDYSGTKTLTYSGPSDSSRGFSPDYTEEVIFVDGVSVSNVTTTLYNAEIVVIDVADGSIQGESNEIEVQAVQARYIEKHSGDEQLGIVGMNLPNPIIVKLLDTYGNESSGYNVDFEIIDGEGQVSPPIATSGANGLAQTTWELGPYAGDYNNILKVSVTDYPEESVLFVGSAHHSVASSIVIFAPEQVQSGDEFVIEMRALDLLGNPALTYNGTKLITYSGPSDSPDGIEPTYQGMVTFVNGVASFIPVVLFAVEETRLNVVIDVDGISGNSGLINVIAGDPDRFVVEVPSEVYADVEFSMVSIRAVDSYGNLVIDYEGTKILEYSGPSDSVDGREPSYTQTVDFALGIAITPLKATLVHPELTQIEVNEGLMTGISNPIRVIYDADFVLYYYSGDNQTGVVGTTLFDPFVVKVLDRYGEPAPGKAVDFEVINGDGVLSRVYMLTDVEGYAYTGFTLGTTVGNHYVDASSDGVVNTVRFTAVATTGTATKLSFSTKTKSLLVGEVSNSFNVCLKDEFGNPALTSTDIDVGLSLLPQTSPLLFANSPHGPWTMHQVTIPAGISCSSSIYLTSSAEGSFTVVGSYPGFAPDNIQVIISPNNITRVVIVPPTFTINYNETQQLVAIAYEGNEVIDFVNVLWDVIDPLKGGINQAGIYYPPREAGTFHNIITASIGSVVGYATPTILEVEPPEPEIIIEYETVVEYETKYETITRQVPGPIQYRTVVPSPVPGESPSTYKEGHKIVINKYYLTGEEGEEYVVIRDSNIPTILSPRPNTMVNQLVVSGTGPANSIILVKNSANEILGSSTTDSLGYWRIHITQERIGATGSAQIYANVYGTNVNSASVSFNIRTKGLVERMLDLLY